MRHPRDRSRRRYRIPGVSDVGATGAARLRIGLNVQGWMRKSKRLARVVANLPKIRLGYEGKHSVLNVANQSIAKHALANGDEIWTTTDGLFADMAEVLRGGLVRVARNEQRDCADEMQELADMIREDVFYNIWDAKIDGPERTAEWISYKGAKWGNRQNMVASGEWVNALTATLVSR